MMPGLDDSELAELRHALIGLRDELTATIAAAAGSAAPVDLDQPIGRVSRIDAIQQQSMAQAGRRAAQLRLQQVEAALRRHDAGEYGSCLECGDAVGAQRLRARPEAPFCLACQSRSEARRS